MERRASASRRIANVLLSVVLVLGLMPAPAFAGDDANDAAGSAATAAQGRQGDSSAAAGSSDARADSPAAQQDAAVIDADDSNGGESLPEAGDISAFMEPDTTAGAFDIDAAPASDGSSALSEGGASLTPGWTQSGTCEWKIDDVGLLTVRPLGNGASGELAGWNSYAGAPWYPQRESVKSAVIESGVSARTCYYMFYGCSSLSSLDLSHLDTSKVTNMVGMFSGCSSLKTIFVSRLFTTAEVGSSNRMFDGCCLLAGGAGTVYDSSFVNSARARIDGGSDDPGYFTGKHEKLDGDVNGNGILNVVDAQIVYDIATTDFYKDRQDYADMRVRADVTWDDEVDASDAFAIQYAALRGW